jgi:hypothetical protein
MYLKGANTGGDEEGGGGGGGGGGGRGYNMHTNFQPQTTADTNGHYYHSSTRGKVTDAVDTTDKTQQHR